jgi:hypothetical protein
MISVNTHQYSLLIIPSFLDLISRNNNTFSDPDRNQNKKEFVKRVEYIEDALAGINS